MLFTRPHSFQQRASLRYPAVFPRSLVL